jgi:hypothetical protein
MDTRRWTNPHQPQTMQIAVFLLYINAFFQVIFGGLFGPIGLAIGVGGVAAGFGMANEQKWGYVLGLAVAALPLVLRIVSGDPLYNFAGLILEVALVALLLHPQSRDYQRIWFS